MEHKKVIDPIDAYVGQQLRLGRTMRGLSQQKLGTCISTTYQQIQKYEQGFNRISLSRLVKFASYLELPLDWFLGQLIAPKDKDNQNACISWGGESCIAWVDTKGIRPQEIQELLNGYCNLSGSKERGLVRKIIASMQE